MAVAPCLKITHTGRADGPAECLLLANIEDLKSQQIMRAYTEQWGLRCRTTAITACTCFELFLFLSWIVR